MINFNLFYQQIATESLSIWLQFLPVKIAIWQRNNIHGKFNIWDKSLSNIPLLNPQYLDLVNNVSAQINNISTSQRNSIEKLLRNFMPWRKGPYSLYGIYIDTEWRSDWKWNRIFPNISSLKDRTILDVGCGNGYHMWRMVGAGAKLVIGIDLVQLFLYQFEVIRKLLGNNRNLHLLPLALKQLPITKSFDTVFSMGVLYHCRSPFDHLLQLKNQLVHNGELVLETLVIAGDKNTVLVPSKRYAQMRNIYFIPSAKALKNWLEKCGFVDIKIIDSTSTSINEQRQTNWMTSKSLADFLNPNDNTKTIEGYSSPLRAILIARKP
ncbi:tRNA 5-methoxyuridine(34)/uridine 5-oxyacetic acid(34) synthase CmoB [Pantoea sp. Aalb]|uniref:tRNA 5-methoxyuridine(34)/uridine 5-oxyacetic acid(34) synthase CmoB n=1 Tax=Pantoea sp. Aalb TaxID=2576762 RepID=UPI001324AD30|nr:tRNA 5-methoxyuridine(34)/uridine 5-oxyacetic acid(34) synthase CmoB [Pantoea sp. Aalb]MXP67356.1 tRNA 5-methoxyuridine(34)/uridine 5-oxyacetic acid(34) synthase CmoB [Pantoea sp. Aalb]